MAALMLFCLNSFAQLKPTATNDTSKYPKKYGGNSIVNTIVSQSDYSDISSIESTSSLSYYGLIVSYPGYLVCSEQGDTLSLDSLYRIKFIRLDGQLYEIVRTPSYLRTYPTIELSGRVFYDNIYVDTVPLTKPHKISKE